MVIVTCRIHYYDRKFFTLTSFGGLRTKALRTTSIPQVTWTRSPGLAVSLDYDHLLPAPDPTGSWSGLGWEELKEAPVIGKLRMVGYHPSSSDYPSSISAYFLWGDWFLGFLAYGTIGVGAHESDGSRRVTGSKHQNFSISISRFPRQITMRLWNIISLRQVIIIT